jgi:hypothetical protein
LLVEGSTQGTKGLVTFDSCSKTLDPET